MVWVTPRTWEAGETVTSSIMNVQIRDQFNDLKTDVDHSVKVLFSSATPVGNQGAGLDPLISYPMPPNTLDADDIALHISGYIVTAGAGTKVIELHFGASNIQLFNSVAATRHLFEAYVYRTGVAGQFMYGTDISASGVQQVREASPTEDETGAIVIEFKGSDTSAVNDNVLQKAMAVRKIPVPA